MLCWTLCAAQSTDSTQCAQGYAFSHVSYMYTCMYIYLYIYMYVNKKRLFTTLLLENLPLSVFYCSLTEWKRLQCGLLSRASLYRQNKSTYVLMPRWCLVPKPLNIILSNPWPLKIKPSNTMLATLLLVYCLEWMLGYHNENVWSCRQVKY